MNDLGLRGGASRRARAKAHRSSDDLRRTALAALTQLAHYAMIFLGNRGRHPSHSPGSIALIARARGRGRGCRRVPVLARGGPWRRARRHRAAGAARDDGAARAARRRRAEGPAGRGHAYSNRRHRHGRCLNGGRSLFSDVQADLAGDVVLGNLEGTLSSEGTPPSYAARFLHAGFTVMNLANDHAYDFGASGLEQTISALDTVGLQHTGRPGQATIQRVGQIRVALVGFSSYPWMAAPSPTSHGRSGSIRHASHRADVVIVSMHAGAEGADRQHVHPGAVERYRGENRGDVVRFAHGAVDAGADLVVGHGRACSAGSSGTEDA